VWWGNDTLTPFDFDQNVLRLGEFPGNLGDDHVQATIVQAKRAHEVPVVII